MFRRLSRVLSFSLLLASTALFAQGTLAAATRLVVFEGFYRAT
jgi:hypothetical protein